MHHVCQIRTTLYGTFPRGARRPQASAKPIHAIQPRANILVVQGTYIHANPPIVARAMFGSLNVALDVEQNQQPKLDYLNKV